ncbi:MAG: hypothetical protein ACRC5T_14100 [Cetobacterium sp.]
MYNNVFADYRLMRYVKAKIENGGDISKLFENIIHLAKTSGEYENFPTFFILHSYFFVLKEEDIYEERMTGFEIFIFDKINKIKGVVVNVFKNRKIKIGC